MSRLWLDTPLIRSTALSRPGGRSVWLKMEALQPTGSFKIRGIGHACQVHAAQGCQRFLASSGGNAGLAVAYAGRLLGLPVKVVVPQSTTERARSLLQAEGAEVMVHGASWLEAHAHALSLCRGSDAYIHPFDDPLLWQGHASLIDEVAEAGCRPDAVVVAVGGGGLFSGVVQGLQQRGWTDVPVFAVETDGAASLQAAIAAQALVQLPSISTVATSLGAKVVAAQALHWSQVHPVRPLQVSDREAVGACLRFLDDHRVLVEPACGAALAPVYADDERLGTAREVLVVVCGGSTATLAQIQQWWGALSTAG